VKANVQKAPSFIEPMKALPIEKLPEGDWLYEIKFDGYRALVFEEGKDVRLVSRNKKAFDYPQLLDALKKSPAQLILDGEIAARDEQGRSSFQLPQMFLEGKDLRKQTFRARHKLLGNLRKKPPQNIRLSDELRGSKDELLRVAQEFGLEGLVAKRPNSLYESGQRSGAWVKFNITSLSNSLSAAIGCLKETGNNSALCWSATTVRVGSCSLGRVGTGITEKRNCKRLGV
jgi:bifunctional non-homologous end joining protein LigD